MIDLKQLGLFNQINTEMQEFETEFLEFVATDFPVLHDTSVHLLKAGGKRLRPAITFLAGKLYDSNSSILMSAAMALELLHMAALVHDDIVDESMTRRGCPTVKAQWGNIIAVQTGDYLFAKSLELIAKIDNPEVSRILAKVTVEMCKGEIQQIKSLFDTQQSLKHYYYRIKRKTALLIKTSCLIGGIVSKAPQRQVWALGAYGHALGVAFQIVDDILDINGDATELGKPIGGDLRQGVMTLPMISALELSPRREELNKLLSKADKTDPEVDLAISLIKESGAIDGSLRWVDLYVDRANKYLENLPMVKTREALKDVAEFIRTRKY